jgi:hypothetical protein
MVRKLTADRIRIPRWTIKREALPPFCPDCESRVVRVTTDDRRIFFCSCQILADEYLPRCDERV